MTFHITTSQGTGALVSFSVTNLSTFQPIQPFNPPHSSLPPHFVFLCHPEFISGSPRHPEAHEQRVKGVSHTRLLRVRKAEGSSGNARRFFGRFTPSE